MAVRHRGRPKRASGPAVTRAQLLEIAAREIGEVGYERASFRRIAAAAGVSYGTVQHHFKTKDELWRALVDEILVPYHDAKLPTSPDDAEGAIHNHIRSIIELAVLRPGVSGAILMDRSDGAEERLAYLAEALSETLARDRAMLSLLQEIGMMRPLDVRVVQVVVGVAMASLSSAAPAMRALTGVDVGDEAERQDIAAGIADLLLYGMVPRSEP